MATINDLLIRIVARNLTTRVIRGLQSDLTDMGKATDVWSKKMINIGGFMSYAFIAGSIAMTGAVTGAIKAAIDFESAFAGVRKTVDATEAEFQNLSKGIRQMAKEIPISVIEISKIAEVAGQLGIAKNDILGFTRTMADLGATTNLSAEEAASAIAKFASIMQMPLKDVDRFSSTIVDLGNKTVATESEIVSIATQIVGAGKQIGLTVPEILGLSSTLASLRVPSEMARGAIQRLFSDLENAVYRGGTDLDQFAKISGTSSEGFAKAFKEKPMIAISAFINGLSKIKRESGSMGLTLDDLGMKEIRLRNVLFKLAGAEGELEEQLKMGNQAWKDNIATNIEAQKRYETAASKLKIFWNQIYDLGITLGNFLIPYLTTVTSYLGIFADELGKVASRQEKVKDTQPFGEKVANAMEKIIFIAVMIMNTFSGLKLLFLGLGKIFIEFVTIPIIKASRWMMDTITQFWTFIVQIINKIPDWIPGIKQVQSALIGAFAESASQSTILADSLVYLTDLSDGISKSMQNTATTIETRFDVASDVLGRVRMRFDEVANAAKRVKFTGGVLVAPEGMGPEEPLPPPEIRPPVMLPPFPDMDQLIEDLKTSGYFVEGLIAGFLELGTLNWAEMASEAVNNLYNTMKSGFSSTINEMISGTMTLAEGLEGLWTNIKDAFITAMSTMAAEWLAMQTMLLLKYIFFENTKTAVKTAGESERLAIEAAAAIKSIAIMIALAIKTIAIYAAKAAAAAFSALAGIPFVGPFLAVAAAATAFVKVMQFAKSFEKGTGLKGIEETGPIIAHKGEIILNKRQSDAIRRGENVEIGGKTRTTQTVNMSFNISALDSSNFEDVVQNKIIPLIRENIRDHGKMYNALSEA